jgi:hypothetical protein
MTEKRGDLRSWPEFQSDYGPEATKLVRTVYQTREGKAEACDNALEPGQFVMYAYPETSAAIRYEEYHELTDPDDLTPNSTPDVSLLIVFGLKFDLKEQPSDEA